MTRGEVVPADPAEALAGELEPHGVGEAELAFVLGSGLGGFVDGLERAREIPVEDLAHMPPSRVPGHAGRIVVGELAGVPVVAQLGRVHLYEGHTAAAVTRFVRALARLGTPGIVLTNAAGCLVPQWAPGSLMRLEDHLALQGRPALRGGEQGAGRVYDPALGAALDRAAAELGTPLHRGVYAGLLGPAYETPAEVAMLRWMGAHAVGMSTVAEATAARACGARVAAVSCLTNAAAGIAVEPLRHEDVVAVGGEAARRLGRLFHAAAPELARALAG